MSYTCLTYDKHNLEARCFHLVWGFFSNFTVSLSSNHSGVGAARSGNLTFMVGGVEDEFAAAQELLGCMGSNVVYCGAVGTGQVTFARH